MSYWKKYNQQLHEFAAQMLKHNKENEFNFIEKNFYNHIRDLTALSISLIQMNGEKTSYLKILDYGSNIASWANIQKKINTKSIDLTIFDPFYDMQKIDFDLGFDFRIINDKKYLNDQSYDLTIFGSMIQYWKNFFIDLNSKNFDLSNFVLFTHTPLSLEKTFVSKQFSDYTGDQVIHSVTDLINLFEELSYSLKFKSTLSPEGASVEEKYMHKTIYANLLFSKE